MRKQLFLRVRIGQSAGRNQDSYHARVKKTEPGRLLFESLSRYVGQQPLTIRLHASIDLVPYGGRLSGNVGTKSGDYAADCRGLQVPHAQVAANHRFQFVAPLCTFCSFNHEISHLRESLGQSLHIELIAVLKVAIKSALGKANLLHDRTNAITLRPTLAKDPRGRGNNLGLRLGLLLCRISHLAMRLHSSSKESKIFRGSDPDSHRAANALQESGSRCPLPLR